MTKPLLDWESEITSDSPLVWWGKLDDKYLVEVHHTGERSGRLYIFDHGKNDEEIASWDVDLLYGAEFGPDVDNIAEWEERVADFIDNTHNKQ